MTAVSKKAVERNRRYQKARTRAYRILADAHWEEFQRIFRVELLQVNREFDDMKMRGSVSG